MIANFLQWILGHRTPDYEQAFVVEVRAPREAEPRDPRVERLIFICWILIAIKHIAVIWAVHRYHVPFHQLWVNAPTWIIATTATLFYYGRHYRHV
jgi:hypothetical protein